MSVSTTSVSEVVDGDGSATEVCDSGNGDGSAEVRVGDGSGRKERGTEVVASEASRLSTSTEGQPPQWQAQQWAAAAEKRRRRQRAPRRPEKMSYAPPPRRGRRQAPRQPRWGGGPAAQLLRLAGLDDVGGDGWAPATTTPLADGGGWQRVF